MCQYTNGKTAAPRLRFASYAYDESEQIVKLQILAFPALLYLLLVPAVEKNSEK